MKRSKNQDPRSRKVPTSKHPWKPAYIVSSADVGLANGFLVLKDEPSNDRHPFDLEERTARFGEAVIRLVKKVPRGIDYPENNRLVDQLIGAATSIGANYCEANEGVSKKDFRHPLSRCVKEAKETKFFLRMIAASEPSLANEARPLYREAGELLLIFATIYRK